MFDWTARSRTAPEIQKRCDLLINSFKKEYNPEISTKKSASKKEQVVKKKFKKETVTLGKRSYEESSENEESQVKS